MKLLILTQKVDENDQALGFFIKWIEEFSRRVECVTVICLGEGKHSLPKNVRVLSLGKEAGASRFKYIFRFYKYIWRERDSYDAVFVHMNPEYVILGGIPSKIMGKRVVMWYVHRAINLKLRVAAALADKILSSSKESFRLKSSKAVFVGHGISVEDCVQRRREAGQPLVITSVGRITPIKRLEILIKAIAILNESYPVILKLVGAPVTEEDKLYKITLDKLVESSNLSREVVFEGSLAHEEAMKRICQSDLTVNFAPTGGMDKAVLESLALGVPAFFANEAFHKALGEMTDDFYIPEPDPRKLAESIKSYLDRGQNNIKELKEKVREEYSLEALIKKIISYI